MFYFIFLIFSYYNNYYNMYKKTKLQLLYQIDSHAKYNKNDSEKTCNNENIAEHINKYYNSMTDEEMRAYVVKCMSMKDIKHTLLKYELKYLHREQKNITLRQFAKEADKILSRYQSKAGGFQFGDEKWTKHDSNSKTYIIYDNEIVFENTIHADFLTDAETYEYLQDILLALNEISTNICVTIHKKYSDRDKMYWILLKCVQYEKNEVLKD